MLSGRLLIAEWSLGACLLWLQVPIADKQMLGQIFHTMDADGSGKLDPSEFQVGGSTSS